METIAVEPQEKKAYKKFFDLQQRKKNEIRNAGLEVRLAKLKKIEQWILENRTAIQEALFTDFKKPKEEVDIFESFVALSELRHAIKHLSSWMKPKKMSTPMPLLGSSAYVQYEPKGVALIISPWNFPFMLTVGPLISAIAAGNCVIMKPSENTPAATELLCRMVEELFPPEEVKVFTGDYKVSEALLALPFDHIFFTGSTEVGKIVMTAAAKNLSSVTLELGGKSPAIIGKSADMDDAASKLTWGKITNTGQACVAPDYILVHESRKDELIAKVEEKLQEFLGEKGTEQDSPFYGRVINERHFDRLTSLLEEALDKGAQLELGGNVDKKERYIQPTLISEVPKSAKINEEETFGPILVIHTYSNIDEAIGYVNDRPKPLALYIFSENRKEQNYILQNTSSGSAAINDTLLQFGHRELPFGGVNHSGIGKAHGHYGFLAFSNEKSVLKQRVGATSGKLLYPPYKGFTKMAIDTLMKYF